MIPEMIPITNVSKEITTYLIKWQFFAPMTDMIINTPPPMKNPSG